MGDTFWAALVGGIAGIVTGSISSLVAPWTNWQIDKHRQKVAYKRELIARWRDMCGAVLVDCKEIHGKGYYWLRIGRHPSFTSLRPQLKTESYDEMKMMNDDDTCHMFLVKKIGEIEKRWKLL